MNFLAEIAARAVKAVMESIIGGLQAAYDKWQARQDAQQAAVQGARAAALERTVKDVQDAKKVALRVRTDPAYRQRVRDILAGRTGD